MKVSCPNCNGNITFIPEKQKFLCQYCNKLIDINMLDVTKYFDKNNYYSECRCSSCGSKLIVGDNTLISICSYCGSNQIIQEKYLGNYNPEKIVPFQKGNNDFRKEVDYYIKSKPFISQNFIKYAKFEDIRGIYVPFVMYKINCDAYARGEGANEYTVDEKDGYYTTYYNCKYFETHYEINGNITFDTSIKINDNEMKAIGPFNFDKICDFNPAYLNGFSAEYGNENNLEKKLVDEIIIESEKTIKEKIDEVPENIIVNHYSINLETGERKTNHIYNGGFNKINLIIENKSNLLLPIWFYNCYYKGKQYKFLMNGQTGKIQGEMPVDYIRILFHTLLNSKILLIIFITAIILFSKSPKHTIYIASGYIFVVFIKSIILYHSYKNQYSISSIDNKNTFLHKKITDYKEISRKDYKEKYGEDYLKKQVQIMNNDKLYYNNINENIYKIDRKS